VARNPGCITLSCQCEYRRIDTYLAEGRVRFETKRSVEKIRGAQGDGVVPKYTHWGLRYM
jgi:hypothetical protein